MRGLFGIVRLRTVHMTHSLVAYSSVAGSFRPKYLEISMHRILLAAVVAMTACSDQNFSSIKEQNLGNEPDIEVSPTLLQFGTASRGDDAVIQTFTISSVGEIDLNLDSITLEGVQAESFTILTDVSGLVLPPGTSQDVEVAFVPMGANDLFATATVISDDPDEPFVPVELYGEGAVPELEISPNPLDFGTSYVGCDNELLVEMTNVGTDTLVIDSVSQDGDSSLALGTMDALPITLEPGEITNASFVFSPEGEGVYAGTFPVESNEPVGSRVVDETATGAFAGWYTDRWEIPTDPPTDIMFAIDQSCSMDDDQRRLASNFSTFIALLSSYSNDWQIIIANDDDGCNRTGILTPSTPNYQSLFTDQVDQVGRGSDRFTEALLTVGARAAEAAAYAGGCNYGFMRPGAAFHLVVVSDEPEQSTYLGSDNWSTLVTRMQTAKGDPGMVKVSAIAGDYPGGCGSADAGDGYYQAAQATGGEFISICSDWADTATLEDLASASIIQNTFELLQTPLPETISVFVNGVEITDWTYDPVSNEITLDSAEPTDGDLVEISYGGAASCD